MVNENPNYLINNVIQKNYQKKSKLTYEKVLSNFLILMLKSFILKEI